MLRRGRLDAAHVCRLGRQLADALEHARAHGVVHRDLKSANVVVTPEGRAKVLDFGIARRQTPARAETETQAMTSAPGAAAGTVAYMAPEVLRGAEASARSDIWALGVILYEMATGRLPFAGGEASDVIAPDHQIDHQFTTSPHHVCRSAILSPSVLIAATVMKMNIPGNNASHGSVLIVDCAW